MIALQNQINNKMVALNMKKRSIMSINNQMSFYTKIIIKYHDKLNYLTEVFNALSEDVNTLTKLKIQLKKNRRESKQNDPEMDYSIIFDKITADEFENSQETEEEKFEKNINVHLKDEQERHKLLLEKVNEKERLRLIAFSTAQSNILKKLGVYLKEIPNLKFESQITKFQKMIDIQILCEVEEAKSCINYFTILGLKQKLLNFVKYFNVDLFYIFDIPLLENEICILIKLVNNTTKQKHAQNKLDDTTIIDTSFTLSIRKNITKYNNYVIKYPHNEQIKELVTKICINYELYSNYHIEHCKIESEQNLNKIKEQLNDLQQNELLIVSDLNQLRKILNDDNIVKKREMLIQNRLNILREGVLLTTKFRKIQNLIHFQIQQIEYIPPIINKIIKQIRPTTINAIKNNCSKNDCEICFENKHTYSFYNCNHVICSNCYFNIEHAYIKEHNCPFCRSSVKITNFTPNEFYIN